MIAIPPADESSDESGVRKIAEMGVYSITAFWSIFAYLWLLIILSDEVVHIWEGVVSFLFFPVLVGLAYMADVGMFSPKGKRVQPEPQIIHMSGGGVEANYKVSSLDLYEKADE